MRSATASACSKRRRPAFAEKGSGASLDEIARTAGVGPGTLYRHFPTRDALVAAVYRNETEQLSDAAPSLLKEMPADKALEEWLRRYAALIGTRWPALRSGRSLAGQPVHDADRRAFRRFTAAFWCETSASH